MLKVPDGQQVLSGFRTGSISSHLKWYLMTKPHRDVDNEFEQCYKMCLFTRRECTQEAEYDAKLWKSVFHTLKYHKSSSYT